MQFAKSIIHLFNARAFILATIIGGVLGSAVLLSVNFYTLKQTKFAVFTWVLAVLIVLLDYILIQYNDVGISLVTLFFVLFLGMWAFNAFQRASIEQCIEEGYKILPTWTGALIGLICLSIVVGLNQIKHFASA